MRLSGNTFRIVAFSQQVANRKILVSVSHGSRLKFHVYLQNIHFYLSFFSYHWSRQYTAFKIYYNTMNSIIYNDMINLRK